jgi:hypothetical protein
LLVDSTRITCTLQRARGAWWCVSKATSCRLWLYRYNLQGADFGALHLCCNSVSPWFAAGSVSIVVNLLLRHSFGQFLCRSVHIAYHLHTLRDIDTSFLQHCVRSLNFFVLSRLLPCMWPILCLFVEPMLASLECIATFPVFCSCFATLISTCVFPWVFVHTISTRNHWRCT